MASFTAAQLEALRKQCVQAIARGYDVAHIGLTINELAAETGLRDIPEGTRKGSVGHLLALVMEAKAQLAGKAKPAKKAEPKPAPKPAPEPEPVIEVAPEVGVAPEPEVVAETVAVAEAVEPEKPAADKKAKKRRF